METNQVFENHGQEECSMKQKYEEARLDVIWLNIDVITTSDTTSDQTLILDESGGADGNSWGKFQ